LFTYLCKLEETSEKLDDLSSTSKEVQEGLLRSMWTQEKLTGASCRSRYKKQHDREHPDSLQALSRFLAHDSEEAWTSYRWQDAKPVLSEWRQGWESGINRVVDDVPFRIQRIKSLGNAVVPQQAKEAFEILMGLKQKIIEFQ
jgi:hypothetical protein